MWNCRITVSSMMRVDEEVIYSLASANLADDALYSADDILLEVMKVS